jgi:hypothetical protein
LSDSKVNGWLKLLTLFYDKEEKILLDNRVAVDFDGCNYIYVVSIKDKVMW